MAQEYIEMHWLHHTEVSACPQLESQHRTMSWTIHNFVLICHENSSYLNVSMLRFSAFNIDKHIYYHTGQGGFLNLKLVFVSEMDCNSCARHGIRPRSEHYKQR